jgi:hypothetical protein
MSRFNLFLDGGVIVPHTLGDAKKNAELVFEMIGGVERMADWADTNPGEFYTRIFPKLIERPDQRNRGAGETLEDRLARLEAADRATTINVSGASYAPQVSPMAPVDHSRRYESNDIVPVSRDDGDDDG